MERGLYKKLEIHTLPPKWRMSGVTFHFELFPKAGRHKNDDLAPIFDQRGKK